ncbi:uncharacterized protein LOC117299214 [Asterias rubens]|uniref:uncharacterized protein LOC117299214 n=1 Tax=Asterias rubens TaxID=7604 RepID=UPI001454F145|nr:uncharacterized protein LOC117299214 [Asterias rubens]
MASYFHCGAHVTHLITSKTLQTAPYIRNALGYVQELGNLYNSSGKFKHLYLNLHSADTDNPSPTRLKPICPTRWLTHSAAVKSVLQNFEAVLDALHEAAEDFGTNTSSRASGLHSCLSSGKCILGLFTALSVIQCLEHFNRALQGTDKTVSGMLDAAEVTRRNLLTLRCDQQFREVFEATEQLLIQCNLEPVTLPRKRKLPKRHDDGATQEYTANSAEELCRVDFFKVIDSAISNLKDYFTSTDLILYKDLSDVLLTGSVQPHTIRKYPELTDSLQQQLAFFRNQFSGSSVEDYRNIFLAMVPEVRIMFPQVEQLLRLLLVSPASSCVAERSFSALRRMKTWLRSTMTQKRLNHLMVCHVHRDRLAAVNPQAIAQEFLLKSADTRGRIIDDRRTILNEADRQYGQTLITEANPPKTKMVQMEKKKKKKEVVKKKERKEKEKRKKEKKEEKEIKEKEKKKLEILKVAATTISFTPAADEGIMDFLFAEDMRVGRVGEVNRAGEEFRLDGEGELV